MGEVVALPCRVAVPAEVPALRSPRSQAASVGRPRRSTLSKLRLGGQQVWAAAGGRHRLGPAAIRSPSHAGRRRPGRSASPQASSARQQGCGDPLEHGGLWQPGRGGFFCGKARSVGPCRVPTACSSSSSFRGRGPACFQQPQPRRRSSASQTPGRPMGRGGQSQRCRSGAGQPLCRSLASQWVCPDPPGIEKARPQISASAWCRPAPSARGRRARQSSKFGQGLGAGRGAEMCSPVRIWASFECRRVAASAASRAESRLGLLTGRLAVLAGPARKGPWVSCSARRGAGCPPGRRHELRPRQ